ncbi:MAG: CpsD/CapB family tyrosine-protein kinase [Pyrinomonadaceae bacterium]
MRFLKTLQKKQIEQPLDIEAVDNFVPEEKFGKRGSNTPAELLANQDLKIGTPNSAFDRESDSLVSEVGSEPEAIVVDQIPSNDFAVTHVEDKRVPEFTVDTELVNPHLIAITQPNSAYCEEYRSLRTHVLHKSQKQKLQSIVIASVEPSEGKSITALNLSWLLAQTSGVNALIIDGDLRMPSLTDYLGIETETGLPEVLEGKFPLKDSIIRLEPAGLHLLPGGKARSDVAELLSGSKFKEILREACEMFDYVIIDAPPLGVFADATVLINHAEGALLVVRANHTHYKDIERVLETLPREKMLGAVLNQSEDSLIRESYYKYGYYKKSRR